MGFYFETGAVQLTTAYKPVFCVDNSSVIDLALRKKRDDLFATLSQS